MQSPTPDTQAVLLLCSRLGQPEEDGPKPLGTRQYSALARWLRERSLRPGDLLQPHGRAQLSELLIAEVATDTIERLLDRGAALAIMVERWASRGLWVTSRADPAYPTRYKSYLGQGAPPIIYGVGAQETLQTGGLAVVGSRHATDEDLDFARRVAAACAQQRIPVISGAAKGVDSESMMAAVDRGGFSVGVLAEGLGRAATATRHHEALVEGRLTLISPYEPEARWFPYTAMERNKLVYGLADAAVVVSSTADEGGTWAGATEALKRGQPPLYVKSTGAVASGNGKLLQAGARPFPEEPWTGLRSLLEARVAPTGLFAEEGAAETTPQLTHQEATVAPPQAADEPVQAAASPEPVAAASGGDVYVHVLPVMLNVLREPREECSFAETLNIVPTQAKAWLKRAVAEGKVRKLTKPVRYVALDSMPLFREKSKP